jgi:hypothetical protein
MEVDACRQSLSWCWRTVGRYEGTPGTPSYRVMEFERYQIRMESKEASSGPRQPKDAAPADHC